MGDEGYAYNTRPTAKIYSELPHPSPRIHLVPKKITITPTSDTTSAPSVDRCHYKEKS